ncbi:efflux RND transporter periplasmic adaptor subunit [Rhizobiaceae bacterium BDR2-2]|uniref:Efflux RND transporter periplasmic adaptor subunit n=1 Tax=Ectorhizobium quercum TaxID=2965071 RepID=A0AAE3SUF8_9HYPH|nr:efflux RND transporter periplasmic adaptor subunit [Ectorhizobium quercum]MCX8995964.1 efflux RND transporter periplasmic adaptor subunit [Ectorhizobium quercum]
MRLLAGLVIALAGGAIGAAAVHWKVADPSALLSSAAPSGGGAGEGARAPQPVSVEVTEAREVLTSDDIAAIGSLESDESIQLAPEVAGRVAAINFQEGQAIKAGEVLVLLDDALARASEQEIKVRLDLANANYERARRMTASGTGTTRDLDTALAERSTAETLLNSQRVQVAKHSLSAPFDGVVGLRNVSVGSYVGVGTALVNLEKIDVLKVGFKVPERYLQNIRVGQTVDVSVDAFPGQAFEGTIYAIDPMLDVNGRALNVRARLSNSEMTLRPGLFARIVIKGFDERKAVSIPESAVVARGQERLVWTIVDGHAQEAKIRITARKVGSIEVEGVEPGTVVVTAGQPRLRNGAPVTIVGGEQVARTTGSNG